MFEMAQQSSSVFGTSCPAGSGIVLNREQMVRKTGRITSPQAEAANGEAAVSNAFETGWELPNKHGSWNISVLKFTIARMEKKLLT